MELELALAAIQKCLTLLHDDLGPDTKKLWLINQSIKKSGIINGTDTTKSYLELMWFRDLNTFSQNLFLSKFDILQADTNLPVNTHSRNISYNVKITVSTSEIMSSLAPSRRDSKHFFLLM